MAIVRSFKGIRPDIKYASRVAAVPYDVVSEEEAREIIKDNNLSFLNIDRSEVNLPKDIDNHSIIVYEKAAEILKDFTEKGIFIKDKRPYMYIYRLKMNGHSQLGLVAATSVDEYIDGIIKKHELTRKDKEQDRIKHVDFCNANTGPIFLAYRDKKNITEILEMWTDNHLPVYDFVADDNVEHTAWIINDDMVIDKISEEFKTVENLYIADGHHRVASAAAVAIERREENKSYIGDEEFNYFLSVIFPSSQLKIMDYNRVVLSLNNLTEEVFLERLKDSFHLNIYDGENSYHPKNSHEFGMFFNNKWYILIAKSEIIPNDIVGRLGTSILQDSLLSPILGIDDPRTDKRIDFVGGIRGLKELENRVNTGKAKVAFSLFPTSMKELMEVSDNNNTMPPKSTWFEPKLRSGLFIHDLE